MKNFILITLLLISTNHFAQDKAAIKSKAVTDQTNQMMTNIATDSQLRLEMMQMMIDQTMDKADEMKLLVNQILSNPKMKNMIREVSFQNTNKADDSKNMPGMMKKNNNVMKRTEIQKKPIIKK